MLDNNYLTFVVPVLLNYASLHQEGGSVLNHLGKQAYVDARPFLVVTNEEINKMGLFKTNSTGELIPID